jgi:hypothetical protein
MVTVMSWDEQCGWMNEWGGLAEELRSIFIISRSVSGIALNTYIKLYKLGNLIYFCVLCKFMSIAGPLMRHVNDKYGLH